MRAGREKVGIAGRTGCGKSTLVQALFRMVEPSGGSIRIDGIDTAAIGLFDLRSRLALVPQASAVPYLHTGPLTSWHLWTEANNQTPMSISLARVFLYLPFALRSLSLAIASANPENGK